MRCPLSGGYVQNASSSSGCAHLQEEALGDVATTFNLPVTYGIPDTELASIRHRIFNVHPEGIFIKHFPAGGRFMDAPRRLFVIAHHDWLINPHLTGSVNSRGRYLYGQAAILLHENGDTKNLWCRTTLIHETLHSASLFSRIRPSFTKAIWSMQRNLREGITECLTGYVLLKRHPECYKGWVSNQLDRCSISYRASVRVWCSLCQLVGIKKLAEFYLSTEDNMAHPWNRFSQSIQDKGHQNFAYPLDEAKGFNETEFREICINSIPGFRETYESFTRCYDFESIP